MKPNKKHIMKILRVIGLGLLIIILKFLVPNIFSAGEETIISSFDMTTSVLNQVQTSLTTLP